MLQMNCDNVLHKRGGCRVAAADLLATFVTRPPYSALVLSFALDTVAKRNFR
eukprot:SAG31_NODE_4834_length_2918_cov_1.628946_3_plen_52_part_00